MHALDFGDNDYGSCAAEVLNTIFSDDSDLVNDVIDHFDIDLWYQQKRPGKYQRIFLSSSPASADFWTDGQVRLFISHLSSNKMRMSSLKKELAHWGICAFIAHEDIEPTREWMQEIEAALETMDALAAVVEPGFKESDWCAQEVGYALGRGVDVIPLRAGLDPFGFFGKYQGVQIKGTYPIDVAMGIVQLLLKKPKHRDNLIRALMTALSVAQSSRKANSIKLIDTWAIVTDTQMKYLLEGSSLSDPEKQELGELIDRVGAFRSQEPEASPIEEDIPF